MINSYSSPFNISHKAVEHLFSTGNVYAQEKVDGSQISFTLTHAGELIIRSKNQVIDWNTDLDNNMFKRGVEQILKRREHLTEGWIYRGEYLQKPKHNALAYLRTPIDNIIIYDIDKGEQDYLDLEDMAEEANRIGFESVPLLGILGHKPTIAELDTIINQESILGGVQMEGIVLKNYSLFGVDKKVLMAKYVSQSFRETHSKEWKAQNIGQKDLVYKIIETLTTEARWMKAIQHLTEQGLLTNSPQDIPLLMREITSDVHGEEADWIKEQLFNQFWKEISKGVTRGFPEWYKNWLLTNYGN